VRLVHGFSLQFRITSKPNIACSISDDLELIPRWAELAGLPYLAVGLSGELWVQLSVRHMILFLPAKAPADFLSFYLRDRSTVQPN
jgi:hypothetical protein